MDIQSTTIDIGGKSLVLEIGRFAEQAGGAVTARYGDTMVIATVVMGRVNPGLGYFPLSVDYQEKLYAGGRIKGSRWVKRDGRPSDDAVLKGRVIDRTIRPLFPKGLINEVQIIVTVLSADGENDADMLGMYAVSAALSASNIPFDGPVSAVRIGLDRETKEFIVNPTFEARKNSDLDLVLSGTKAATVMVEAGANEVPEAKMIQAFKLAEDENKRICKEIDAFAATVGKKKTTFTPALPSKELEKTVAKEIGAEAIKKLVKAMALVQPTGMDELVAGILEKHPEFKPGDINETIFDLVKTEARRQTLEDGTRPDGRNLTEIRTLESAVGLLPRTHGSAMFKRGATQALTVTTLGSPALNQLIENMEGEEEIRYIHHYNMPPYTSGETGRVGYPSRREIGHGALAQRALEPMIPSEEDFPYTIHVVSELMSSNGSTSMASVCGSTLSLMDAGVPLKKPVAGIAMGLLVDGDKHLVLTDIQGLEDHTGDMDFKVAGTKDGITAMQMDIKISGIPFDVLTKALEQAREARLFIMEHMLKTIAAPRAQLSAYAPKIETVTIPVDRIGELIGPGGKMIKSIIAETGAEVDVNDEGRVFITSTDQDAINKAKSWITGIFKEIVAGEEYDGTVVRMMDFGAFVEILPGRDGLVHVSRMSTSYVRSPEEVVKVGDKVHVRVSEIDDMGRINLSMLTLEQEAEARQNRPPQGGGMGGGFRPRGGDRDRRGGGDRRGGSRSSGPRLEYR